MEILKNNKSRSNSRLNLKRTLNDESGRQQRLSQIEGLCGESLKSFHFSPLSAESLKGNIENFIGSVHIPVGLAGPLKFKFIGKDEEIYAPLATSEGALVSSVARGALALTMSGGVTTRVLSNRMIRAPQFEFNSVDEAILFSKWVSEHFELLKLKTKEHSNHAILLELDEKVFGKTAHIRFIYSTGDAAGQNMTTFVTAALCRWIIENFTHQKKIVIQDFLIEGNLSSDKKASALSAIDGRGRSVVAEAVIKRQVLKKILRLTPEEMVSRFSRSKSSRIFTGQIGYNINVANSIAALFLATGQDMACVHECSVAEFHIEQQGDDLYVCLLMPCLIVGTVGGGSKLTSAQDCLRMMDCLGAGKADRLAQVITGFSLALELSTVSAIGSGDFVQA
ncbi:MAG: hydroxymethylglutaryl-CoA reductase, partial [Pseudobdellovibrionaceae bacterium]